VEDRDDLTLESIQLIGSNFANNSGSTAAQTGLEAVLPTIGCQGLRCIRLTGSNLGVTQSFLEREGDSGLNSLSVSFGGPDGSRYAATNCSIDRTAGKGN